MIKACVFDAYGTLFDVGAAARIAAAEPGAEGWAPFWPALAANWRRKQLEYTWLRAVAGRHVDFWQVTQDGLDWSLEAAVTTAEAALADPGIESETMRAALVFRTESLLRLHRFDAAIASAGDLEEHFPQEVGGPLVRILGYCAQDDTERAMDAIEQSVASGQLQLLEWRGVLLNWGYATLEDLPNVNADVLEPPLEDVLRRWVGDGCPQPLFDLP